MVTFTVRLFAVLLAALFVSACSGVPFAQNCATQSAEFLSSIEPIAREWDDANKLAGQTPRAALAVQIQNLQAIKRKTEDLKPPECATEAQKDLVKSMDATIEGYLAFLGQKPDATVTTHFTEAGNFMQFYAEDLAKIKGVSTK